VKIRQLLLWIAALGLGSVLGLGQTQPVAPAAAAQDTSIDPAKATDIRMLLDLVGTKELVTQSFGGSMDQIKPLVTKALPPGAYREKLVDLFFAKFQSKVNLDQFLTMAVPVYDKYFTADEIKALIAFYRTPIGKKSISVLPTLTEELRQKGEKWGQEIGRNSMAEVLAEHPDLAAEMEAAGKAGTPR
jgi:hypothetical protein